MPNDWTTPLERWVDAGLVDEATAGRIRAFEAEHDRGGGLRWPVWLALGFGALMIGAGVLLFVAANWDELSPAVRFALVLLLVGGFHAAGARAAERMPSMSVALHAVGTVALGAGIFLAGQIFNLDEHWPGGLMLWALGAAGAWWLLRDNAQMALLAVLAPAWLTGEWAVAVTRYLPGEAGMRVPATGIFLLALAYFTSARGSAVDDRRFVLQWVGGITLPVAAIALAISTSVRALTTAPGELPRLLYLIGSAVALGAPLAIAFVVRRMDAWPLVLAASWAVVLSALASIGVFPYVWWAAGAMALAWWGVRESHPEGLLTRNSRMLHGISERILRFPSTSVEPALVKSWRFFTLWSNLPCRRSSLSTNHRVSCIQGPCVHCWKF